MDWGTYPILTFSDAPEMEIADQPALGAGEPSTVTRAPTVANAIKEANRWLKARKDEGTTDQRRRNDEG